MEGRCYFWGLLALALAAAQLEAGAAEPAKPVVLTKSQQTALTEQLIPAYEQGNPLGVLQALAPMVGKLDDARIEAVDAFLDKQSVPPVGELLANARLTLVEQNLARSLPKPEPRELVLTIKALSAKIEETLADAAKHPVFDAGHPKPKNLKEYEQLFWQMHVLDNRLASTMRIGEYAASLSESGSKLPKQNLSETQQSVLETDFARLQGELLKTRKKLTARDFDLRVDRLGYAEQVLTQSKDLQERFLAAFVLDLDGEQLARQLKLTDLLPEANAGDNAAAKAAAAPDAFAPIEERQAIATISSDQAQAGVKVRKSITQGRKAAGDDLLKKSRMLFTGLHWWYRGRYGSGSDGNGLLKNKLALASPQAMFALYMPKETPTPTDPTKVVGKQIPQIDRRHHYLWQFETRKIATSFGGGSSKKTEIGKTRVTQVTRFDQFL